MTNELVLLKERFVELLVIQDGNTLVSSRDVANEFGKLHKHVLASIESAEFSDDFSRTNFRLAHYKDLQDKPRPHYLMTRDGFSFIVMGFTGKKAAMFKEAFIYAFNEMENRLRNSTILPDFTKPAIAARAWADQFEGRLLAEAEAKENREDAMAYRELSQAIDCQTVQEFCKTIGVKPNLFYKWLRDNGYLMSEQKFKNQPYQYYTHLFEIVMKKLDNKKATVLVTVINQKGVDFFTKKKIKGCFDSILKNKF